MGASITLAGESLISQKQAARQTVDVSRFILAKVPGLDTTLPVDRAAGVPDANLIVHTTPVTREGYLATNKVVYSLMLGTDVGDFDFNWMGLVTAEDVLLIAAYVPLQQKRREIPPLQAGNNLTSTSSGNTTARNRCRGLRFRPAPGSSTSPPTSRRSTPSWPT